ncbi:CRISPR-associated helicase Cas3' [Microbacterium sp.]|uniref:CRISPR-associated helicase Cas3' n=1 Tax=Microbacterium sp. TaxID=51671 RepID=UPI0039E3D625
MTQHLASGEFSRRARSVWAKTRTGPGPDFALQGWLPLVQHLADTAAVAALLWEEWVPESLKSMLTDAVGTRSAARDLVVWLAGTHDVGKASPAFAVQVPLLADVMRDEDLEIDPRIKDGDERRQVRHELVSYLAIRDWLQLVHGFSKLAAGRLASVAAAHHGQPPSRQLVSEAEPRPHLVGSGSWIDVRNELLAAADRDHASVGSGEQWRAAEFTQPVLVMLSAIVIVSDWIASSDLFDAAPLGEPPRDTTEDRVARAWADLDFPRAWAPRSDQTDVTAMLTARFDLPAGAAPRPAQEAFVRQAMQVERPELMILEAEMGSGKTEAALLAAEILAGRFGLSGVFVGLPTQATTDGMFSRVLQWADRLDLDTPASLFLARGKSMLNPEFAQKSREAHFRSIGDDYAARRESDESLVVAHRWFSDPRRGPLSNFVVGTVDQALFAGLRSKYLMLRHLALASKVVIIDEVHAYDAYMQEYLTRVIEWLGAYRVPVILLSATLASSQRRAFVEAYDRGREALEPAPPLDPSMSGAERAERRAVSAQAKEARYRRLDGDFWYPAITVSQWRRPPALTLPGGASDTRRLHIDRIPDDHIVLIDLLRSALRDGGNVAVIRNTVSRAQETAALLRDAFGGDLPVTLAHSRFLGLDRARKDRELLSAYGPKGDRPKRSIVVATQVIEQSLDIDFDLMVTDTAPIDLLLQRSGRLHRHLRAGRPLPLREPRLVLTGTNWDAEPPQFVRGSTRVYSEAILLRTTAALHGRDVLSVPDDIAYLVETVYSHDLSFIPTGWRDAVDDATRKHEREQQRLRDKAHSFRLQGVAEGSSTLLGWISGPDVDPDLTPPGRATVRDGDETLEVIVLQRRIDGGLATPAWLAGGPRDIPVNEAPRGALTRTILGCTLRLPAGMCHGNAIDRHIATLERGFELPEWHASPALRGELVLVVDGDGRARLNEFDLRYTPDDGLTFARAG